MPTYEYRCAEGHRFEAFQKISDEPLDTCPECGSEARRLVSAGAGLLFKGEGFYITDYRSEEYRKKAAEEKGDGKGSDASSEKTGSGGSDGGGAGGSGGSANGAAGGDSGNKAGGNGTQSGTDKGASGGTGGGTGNS